MPHRISVAPKPQSFLLCSTRLSPTHPPVRPSMPRWSAHTLLTAMTRRPSPPGTLSSTHSPRHRNASRSRSSSQMAMLAPTTPLLSSLFITNCCPNWLVTPRVSPSPPPRQAIDVRRSSRFRSQKSNQRRPARRPPASPLSTSPQRAIPWSCLRTTSPTAKCSNATLAV